MVKHEHGLAGARGQVSLVDESNFVGLAGPFNQSVIDIIPLSRHSSIHGGVIGVAAEFHLSRRSNDETRLKTR